MLILFRWVLSGLLTIGMFFAASKIISQWQLNRIEVNISTENYTQAAHSLNKFGLVWKKNVLTIPSEMWKVRNLQNNLHEGDEYFLIEEIEPTFSCLLGQFTLASFSAGRLLFYGEKSAMRSRLEKFALAHHLALKISVVTLNQLPHFSQVNLCKNWYQIENL